MLSDRLSRWERVLYITILVLALFSRFYILGERAISHDESIHTKFSWNLYNAADFQHNPMMHGPLLFEVTALNYFLFGANDFTSRIFPALMGVALVLSPLLFRKWMGKSGAALASVMLLISPSISYYSRYIRHDAPVMLFAVLWMWVIFKYVENGHPKWLYWMAAFFSLMHASKEVNYIYIAIVGGLLFLPFAWQVITTKWQRSDLFAGFVLALIAALLLGGVFAFSFLGANVEQQNLDEAGNTQVANVEIPMWGRIAAALAFVTLFTALILIYYGIGEKTMRDIRLFDVLMAVGTLTLPLGSAFLIKFVAGIDMGIVYESVRTGNFSTMPMPTVVGIFAVVSISLAASVALGLWWDKKRWPIIALVHYVIFFVTYTTIFTWGFGSLSGLVGSLAYWLAQQGVERGSQPWYYYLIVGPMYDYLPILFSIGAGVGSIVYAFKLRVKSEELRVKNEESEISDPQLTTYNPKPTTLTPYSLLLTPFFPLFLLGWTILAWFAYTYAGEKMPWLLVHITLPSAFLAGWGLGRVVDALDLNVFIAKKENALRDVALFVMALPLMIAALLVLGRSFGTLSQAFAPGISTAGPTLTQLEPLGKVLGGGLGSVAFGWLLFWSVSKIGVGRAFRLSILVFALFLSLLTVRTMMMFNFVNYDMATEHLVYAHAAPGIKMALKRVQDVSWRVTGAQYDVKVAYGEDGSWPFTWYMVDYPNNYFYSTNPDREQLLQCPVVIAGSPQYGVVEEILGTDYVHFDYKYLWWPVEDYKNLTVERIRNALFDPSMRAALWDIVWDRDYTAYASLKNPENPFTLQTWPYRKDFRLYVRKNLVREVWGYRMGSEGARVIAPQATQIPDPYQAGERPLPTVNQAALANAAPRGIAVADDGSLYVADTLNHRVWHITPQGAVLDSIGDYGSGPGQFVEPWDVDVDSVGNVYVTDTWNHRIQKFDTNGQHLRTWGTLAQVAAFDPAGQGAFFGPRGIAIGPGDEVFVTDTGNKRVQVFDAMGTFLREFGGSGPNAGQMDEPVGIAISDDELVFIADTWNGRVQVFTVEGAFVRQWDIPTWSSENPDEKPFLGLGDGLVFVSDPTHRRVLAFNIEGSFQWALIGGDYGALTFPVAAATSDGVIYVTDAYAARVEGFEVP